MSTYFDHLLLLGRIAILRTQMRPIVADQVTWSVDLSVTVVSPAKSGGRANRDAVWVEDSGWPTEPWGLLAGVYWLGIQIPNGEGAVLRGKTGRPVVNYSDSLP